MLIALLLGLGAGIAAWQWRADAAADAEPEPPEPTQAYEPARPAEPSSDGEAAAPLATETMQTGVDVQPGERTIEQTISDSADWAALVAEHWELAMAGNIESMVIAYNALNNCATFKEEIRIAENEDELALTLADRHPRDRQFAQNVFPRCKQLVEQFDAYPNWRELRFKAAQAGHPTSKAWVAVSYYNQQDATERETLPYSPAEYLIDAMQSGDPTVFRLIAGFGEHNGMLHDDSTATTTAWSLLECRFRDDCASPSSIVNLCTTPVPECDNATNMFDIFRNRAGDDKTYAAALAEADALFEQIEAERWNDLGLELVW